MFRAWIYVQPQPVIAALPVEPAAVNLSSARVFEIRLGSISDEGGPRTRRRRDRGGSWILASLHLSSDTGRSAATAFRGPTGHRNLYFPVDESTRMSS